MIITPHAYSRAKERCGLNKSAFNHMLEKALINNWSHAYAKPQLHKYITALTMKHKFPFKVLLHDKYMILHTNEVVITVYQLPNTLLPLKNFIKDKSC